MPSDHSSGQAVDRIAAALRQRIIAGELPPGTPLRDGAFAGEFGVSRNTMREALRLLRHDGLLEHRVHRGATVRSLTPDDVRDIYAARRCIELRAVQESAVADEAALAEIASAVQEAERALRSGEWSMVGTASLAFHQAVVALLSSPSLDSFFAGIVARLRLAFAVMADEAAFQRPWVPRDREIWEGIRSGRRTDAEGLLRIYLDDSERMVLDVVRGSVVHRSTDGAQRSGDVRVATPGI